MGGGARERLETLGTLTNFKVTLDSFFFFFLMKSMLARFKRESTERLGQSVKWNELSSACSSTYTPVRFLPGT